MTRSRLIRLIVIAGMVGAVAIGIRFFFFGASETPRLLTATVALVDIEKTVIATGTLEAYQQVSVGAQVSGQIKSLKVDLGDRVSKGDLIAEIDSITQHNTLKNARAELARIEAQRAAKAAQMKQAELAFQRQKKMLAQKASSQEDFEAAEATLNTTIADIAALDAQIEQAKIQVSTAEVNVGYTRITAPIDGTVVAVVVKEGQTVNSVQQAPTIVKLARLDTMTIKAEISEADVVNVRPGQNVYFTILGEPNKRRYATLRAIEPAPSTINTETTTSSTSSSTSSSNTAIYYNGIFDVPNDDGKLRISMTAQVSIILAGAEGVPGLPTAALNAPHPDGSYTVNVVDKSGAITERKIRIGVDDGVNAQIIEGLVVGEQVLLGDAAKGSSTQVRRMPMRL